jgi:chromosome segregation ATPase
MRKNISQQPVSDVEKDAQLAEGRKASAESEVLMLSNTKKTIEKSIETLETEKTNLLREKDGVLADIEVVKKNRAEVTASYEIFCEKISDEKDRLNSSIETINNEIEILTLSKNRLDKDIVSLSEEKLKKEKEIAVLNGEIVILEESGRALIDKNNELNKEIVKTEGVITKKNEESVGISKAIEILISNKADLERDIDTKNSELISLNSSISLAQNELKLVQQELSDTKESVEKEKGKIQAKQEELDEKARLVDLAYQRVESKTQYLQKLIEKAQIDGIIKDFKI